MSIPIIRDKADDKAEWIAGNPDSIAEWDYDKNSGVAYHKVWRQKQLEFSEESDQANWVSVLTIRDRYIERDSGMVTMANCGKGLLVLRYGGQQRPHLSIWFRRRCQKAVQERRQALEY